MIRVGKIVATHGLQGAMVLTHIAGASDWLKKDSVLFFEINKGSYIPFFVTGFRANNDKEYVVNVEDVMQVEAAKKMIGKQVYIQEDVIADHAKDSPLLWIGFNIVDKEKGSLGKVEDVMQTGHQWLAKIIYEEREILIPLIEQMILDVNLRNKFIRMELPDGLLEL